MLFFRQVNDIDIVLKNLSKIPHSQSYRRKDIPDRYHYKNHERIGDILLVFEPGHEIHRHPSRREFVLIFIVFLLAYETGIKVVEKDII